jgi:hypothetical protein
MGKICWKSFRRDFSVLFSLKSLSGHKTAFRRSLSYFLCGKFCSVQNFTSVLIT